MAVTSTQDFTTGFSRPAAGGMTLWQRLGRNLALYARARSRTDEIERLEALSDAELAAHGLTRDRIVMHVFRDIAWV